MFFTISWTDLQIYWMSLVVDDSTTMYMYVLNQVKEEDNSEKST